MLKENLLTHFPFYQERKKASEFPLMIVISIVYPCNFGCPHCPYSDGNSSIRRFYHEKGGDMISPLLWEKIAREAGKFGAWLRCTGGGEPLLHPQMVEMAEYAKAQGARVWLNTNGSLLGPYKKGREKLRRLVRAGVDVLEFSMDAADPETYSKVRPPRHGLPKNPQRWWADHLDNVKTALLLREELNSPTRILVSLVAQKALRGKLEKAKEFWLWEVGVDEVILRKFLTWDSQTSLSFQEALDEDLYEELKRGGKEPCVWLFERLNVDTLGRVALCGQDVSFRTSSLFPSLYEKSIQEIWQGEVFSSYREKHLLGRGSECFPCRECSAWKAGIRSWEESWLKVLKKSQAKRKLEE